MALPGTSVAGSIRIPIERPPRISAARSSWPASEMPETGYAALDPHGVTIFDPWQRRGSGVAP